MLEGLVAWVLNNYLGKYVENLNTDQLSIALLSGKVELENLPIKKDALRHFGLPVEIKAGFIGRAELQIPVRQIRSAPWVIDIKQVYLVASPLSTYEWDAELESLVAQDVKLGSLDATEAQWRLQVETKDPSSTYYASSYFSWLGLGAGIVADIIENLHLRIQDVHIRYEDRISITDKVMGFGITMEALSVQSCNSSWEPTFLNFSKNESFKLMELQKFGFYLIDLEESQIFSELSLGELAVAMSQPEFLKQMQHHILKPANATAHVRRNRSDQPSKHNDAPRFVCDLLLDEVPFTVIDWQYDQLVRCIQSLNTIERLRSYRRFKPSCSVKEDPRAWWIYAINCFYPGGPPSFTRPKPTLSSCLIKARQNVRYVSIYTKLLMNPNTVLTVVEKKLKNEVEWHRDIEELKILREVSMLSIPRTDTNSNIDDSAAGRNMLFSWFPQWMGWYSPTVADSGGDISPESTQLDGEILRGLAGPKEPTTGGSVMTKENDVFGQFNFCLKHGFLTLCTSDPHRPSKSESMLEFEIKNLSLRLSNKSGTAINMVELSLDDLRLRDKITLNSVFPILVGPPGFDRTSLVKCDGKSPADKKSSVLDDHLFYLSYEKKPPSRASYDHRLSIHSKSLDIVYQPNVLNWLIEFLCLPHQRDNIQKTYYSKIEEMKNKTKKELFKNWEQMLNGREVTRTAWDLNLDISAPQIIFVENFTDSNSAIAVLDFGKLLLSSHSDEHDFSKKKIASFAKDTDESETFLTPCSTPPVSEASDLEDVSPEPLSLEHDGSFLFSEKTIHQRLYDRYCVQMIDLQILIGKVKDNWRFAQNKGSSTLHVVDKFNICLQIEKRIVHTVDPLYPSLIVGTNIPKLVTHLSENKIATARSLIKILTAVGLPKPLKTPAQDVDTVDSEEYSEESYSSNSNSEMSGLLMIQFAADDVSLELQSRGRCVAELQVTGVKVDFTKRPNDINITLTVHNLLLVDALQTFGPDFELLVASHKHVGMDFMSGSIKDSEPTSPICPGSPTNSYGPSVCGLSHALNSLTNAASPLSSISKPSFVDTEALIRIEIVIITQQETVQFANIHFNNVDIIANQETIVELVGFIQRVFPTHKDLSKSHSSPIHSKTRESTESLLGDGGGGGGGGSGGAKLNSTEVSFHFHHLNVLLLRGIMKDGVHCAKKICTATLSDVKVETTFGNKLEVLGSLGGLQILNLMPEGAMHQRILSVGRDPSFDVVPLCAPHEEGSAFVFKIVRHLEDAEVADVTVRMASLWYIHSVQLVAELQSWTTEFKQYVSNLARTIRSAATDMALGLVHSSAEALAQSLYVNTRLSAVHGGSTPYPDSPRKRTRRLSMDFSNYSSCKTPATPNSDDDFTIELRLDIDLESPVVVLPEASNSPKVFVAHLGQIKITNNTEHDSRTNEYIPGYGEVHVENYIIDVRDMNLFSVDTSNRRVFEPSLSKPEILYSCKSSAKPIIHDTILQLKVKREVKIATANSTEFIFNEDSKANRHGGGEHVYVKGNIVNDLKISLSRSQYKQLLDTIQWLSLSFDVTEDPEVDAEQSKRRDSRVLSDIIEEDTGVTTLNMDPHVRAKLFPPVQSASKITGGSQNAVLLTILFDLPNFIIELRGDLPTGEQSLIALSLRDFSFNFEKTNSYETNVRVSLRSVFMEDLLQPNNSTQRVMMASSFNSKIPQGSICISRSCPDVVLKSSSNLINASLPNHLKADSQFVTSYGEVFGKADDTTATEFLSMSGIDIDKNLVLINTLIVDTSAPNFATFYNSTERSTTVDFNCLDLTVNVESWVIIVDFFNVSDLSHSHSNPAFRAVQIQEDIKDDNAIEKNSETNITIQSLTAVLVRSNIEIAKANISDLNCAIKTKGVFKEVEGKLGSMSLHDSTLHGQLYRERFLTFGEQALQFKYVRNVPAEDLTFDAHLSIEMSSIMYVHTKRFVAEIQAFFNHFTQLQTVMRGIRAATSGQLIHSDVPKLSLKLKTDSPMIFLPVSSSSSDILVVDLGQLMINNSLKYSSPEGVQIANSEKCLTDVMQIELKNMDLYSIRRDDGNGDRVDSLTDQFKHLCSNSTKNRSSFLKEKIHLNFQVDRNLSKTVCHNIPDMSIYGQLSTLDFVLNLSQYRLIRGLLSFNLGEDTEKLLPSIYSTFATNESTNDVWILSSYKFDLQNVSLSLQMDNGSPLTCIKFIKSRLSMDAYSNFTQDVDLISQEILIFDTRNDAKKQQADVFKNILEPARYSKQNNPVQVEIHCRNRQNHVKYTVLLNNMRLLAIFTWWAAFQEYIFQKIGENVPHASGAIQKSDVTPTQQEDMSIEFKMNITDSEIVLIEDMSRKDSNLVVLKSTTVVTYKSANAEKPLSCSLGNCEMFSCISGLEEDTALSIIEPVTLNIDLLKENTLEIQLQLLTVRLSYQDMCMFLQLLNSIPQQMFAHEEGKSGVIPKKSQVTKLETLGFKVADCIKALEECDHKLDDAALWLTHNAVLSVESGGDGGLFNVKSIEVKAKCISIYIIDDCGDSDVPLLELSLSQLNLQQTLPNFDSETSIYFKGSLECILASDYYNRILSGWEPCIEPWKCCIGWDKSLSRDLQRNRFNFTVASESRLNFTITATLIGLYKLVRENWTSDYYSDGKVTRHRTPFVPFALKNETGSPLYFTTLISELNKNKTSANKETENWTTVMPGETAAFSFKNRGKLRHQDSHKMKLHQIRVKVQGWQPLTPVAVDKVGTYFRVASAQIQSRTIAEIPPTRIVFDISLEGSARKLIRVRSALVCTNNLPQPVELKLENQLPQDAVIFWTACKTFEIRNGESFSVPLEHVYSLISVRPLDSDNPFTYCSPILSWFQMPFDMNSLYELRTCHTHKGRKYVFATHLIRELQPLEKLGVEQPAHRIILTPSFTLHNTLPVDLSYSLSGDFGRVQAGSTASLTNVSFEESIELNVMLENFTSSKIIIPFNCAVDLKYRVVMEDERKRKLFVTAVVAFISSAKMKITLLAPYWIINKTGLPLVFRQHGATHESAGQFQENELARMVCPLPFSFSDEDASPTICARVGNHLLKNGSSQWCSNFHVQKGVQVRNIHVTMPNNKPDTVFVVGIEVRAGRGKYRSTSIITISPRYQLYNKTSYQLKFIQQHFAESLADPKLQKSVLQVIPNSHVPFHWSRLDKEQLLCVSIDDVKDCCWSCGLHIEKVKSSHVNIRDINGRMYFLRLEVLLQGATFFIIVTDADKLPPPIRIDNFSEVSITFVQEGCKNLLHSTARAHSSVPYAWDQHNASESLVLIGPGGVSNTYDMKKLGKGPCLTYENFIYIAFTGTFRTGQSLTNSFDVESQELVLDVIKGGQVILAKKRHGQRSQLWRMTADGHLQHEGSCPPSHSTSGSKSASNKFVLDIDNTAVQPHCQSKLMLRRVDLRRRSTQTWRFTSQGRLCCAHFDMCVQALDGFFGLRQGSSAVLGMLQQSSGDGGVPIEQAVGRQRLRPGSGLLAVEIGMDGPTTVLTIKDMKEDRMYSTMDDQDWIESSVIKNTSDYGGASGMERIRDYQLTVKIEGLGVSLVSQKTSEELLYASFSTLVGEAVITPASKQFCISVGDVQIDNQLFDSPVPVLLYVTPPSLRNDDEVNQKLPAIDFSGELDQEKLSENAVMFRYLILRLKKFTIILEEKLILKLVDFIGYNYNEEECIGQDENDYEVQRMLLEMSSVHVTRYYFGILQLIFEQIKLSVKTAVKLSPQLQEIKRRLGLTLIKFEDASIDLQPFNLRHPFETGQFLINSIVKHFKDELMWQAAIILGSVDFLGNPLGFVSDVSEGFSGLLFEGNVGALVKSLTHGISDSTVKVTESISDGLGSAVLDDDHEEIRQKIRQVASGRSRDHLVAGLKGLGFGILGGATGLFKHVYEGASNDGLPGVFSGLGKGLVGAVTKPVVGVLDFASEAARAVRDSSRSKLVPERTRLPRCVNGRGGLLPRYNLKQSQGQQYLYSVNDKDYTEHLIAYEILGSASEDLHCIVSNLKLRIIASTNSPNLTPVVDCNLSDLETCTALTEIEGSDCRYYIEIVVHISGGTGASLMNLDPVKKPKIRCKSSEIAKSISQQINYAKNLYTERLFTIVSDKIVSLED